MQDLAGCAWDQRGDESAEAYQAFVVYRDLGAGERSHAAAARHLGKHVTLLNRWGARHDWASRVAAYDAEQYRQLSVIRERARRERAEKAEARRGQLADRRWAYFVELDAKAVAMLNPKGTEGPGPVASSAKELLLVAALMKYAAEFAAAAVAPEPEARDDGPTQAAELPVEFKAQLEMIYGDKPPAEADAP